jgi:hypothetical protein
MAKIESYKRIAKEEFNDDDKDMAERVGVCFNSFAKNTQDALRGTLNFENFNQKIATLEVTTISGVPTIPTTIKSSINGKLEGILCIYAENLTKSDNYLDGQPFIVYEEKDKIVTVKYVTGLKDSQKYRLKLILIGN